MPSRAAVYIQQTPRPHFGPARPPKAPRKSNIDHRPRLALLQLHKESCFDQQYASVLSALSSRAEVELVTTKTQASALFNSTVQPIVLATDQALAEPSNTALRDEARQYVERGGVLILCCHFASFVQKQDVETFFSSFSLYWRRGDCHRTEHDVNRAVGSIDTSGLVSRYSQHALHLRDVDTKDAIYLPTASAYVQSRVCPPSPVEDRSQTPAALVGCGQGRLGYLGDVNGEEGTVQVLLTMCGLR